jgi:23S rRNA (cytosine1962-C5)-methyltransferase
VHNCGSNKTTAAMKDWIDFGLLRDFAAEKTEAYRLCTKPEGWVERYGPDALISYKTEAARDTILRELGDWSRLANQRFERIFARYLPKQNAERDAPALLAGDPTAPLQRTVLERSVCYAIDFGAGYSAGLFLDQRENRQFVRRTAPRRTLNCFAYTCSFSVVAGLAGGSTVSVDLSNKSLRRGRENFTLNGMSMNQHCFMADDVMAVLPRLARKGELFDAIILDPPTFSRSRTGKAFQVAHDFEKLLLAALPLAERAAKILLSTNCARLDVHTLEVMGRFCLKATRRAGNFIPSVPLPDFPRGAGARSLWLLLR